MGKTLCILSGLFLLSVAVWVTASMVPDHMEAMAFNYLARTAEDAKREAILASPEIQTLEIEIEELQAQLTTAVAACPAEEEPRGWQARLAGFLPW